ncbi:MAG: DUF6530 family protein [Bacillota bacterium]
MKIPVNLKHKPVFCVEDYDKIDGRFAGHSDAKGLTLGLAQWNDRGKVDISIKIWRHTGGKWSRQSEELPLHRVIDMAILVCQTKSYLSTAYRYPKLYDETKPFIAKIGAQGEAMTFGVCKDNVRLDEDISLFRDALIKDDELLSERLHLLANKLYEAGYGKHIQN